MEQSAWCLVHSEHSVSARCLCSLSSGICVPSRLEAGVGSPGSPACSLWPSRSPSRPKPSSPPLPSPSLLARPSLPLHTERRNIRRELPGLPPSPKRSSICTSSGWLGEQGALLPSSDLAPAPSAASGSCSPIQPPSPPFMSKPYSIEPSPATATALPFLILSV